MDNKLRREKYFDLIEDNSVTVLYSRDLIQESADEAYPFLVDKNFYYLTGIEQADVYLILLKKGEVKKATLYIEKNDPVLIKWVGEKLYKDEAKEISKVDEVKYLSSFKNDLKKIILENKINKVYLNKENIPFRGSFDFVLQLELLIKSFKKRIKIEDSYKLITTLRGCKEEEEIALFKKDVHITNLALQEVMKHLKDCQHEYQVQAIFEGSIKYFGNAKTSFTTIAASGVNAATLHYSKNNCPLNREDMILLDLGADNNYYHADISRTYPISGHFSPLQRTIYSIVLECNKHIIKMIKPGVSIVDLQKETIEFLAKGCLENGLIKEKEEIKNYYFHGVSHHIGLDTHDPYPDRKAPLKEGMIISCEPGLYFKELGIGVRIEDDILVTKDGSINLSEEIIKEIDEVEAYIQKYL